ncbi:MAG: CHAT domain-containing protein, partial [Anaerolineae bacterium]
MASPRSEILTCHDLIEQALELSDLEAQKCLFQDYFPLLDDECAEGLKAQADQSLRSDIQRCRETAQLLLVQAEVNGNSLHRALGLLAEANALSIGLGEYQRGVELYDEAAAIYEAHGEPVRQARSQIGKIYALGHLGRYQEAQEAGEWASQILEDHARWEPLASLTLNLGILHGRLGEDAKSLAYFDRARELYVQLGKEREPLLSWIDQDRAIALRNLGRFEESIAANQGAWQLMTESGQTVEAARPQQALAITYFVLGRYNEAMVHLDQARKVFLEDGRQRDAILVELYITDCLLQLRRFPDVLDKCRQIREGFTELGTRFEVAQALLNEAVAYAGLTRTSEAIDSLVEARQMFVAEGNRLWVACTDLEMALLYLQQSRFSESFEIAHACARTFRSQELPVRQARAHLIAARAAFSLSQYDQARQRVERTLDLAESRDIPSLTYQAYHLLGALAVAEGDLEQGLAEYDRAICEVERLRGRLMVEFRVGFVGDKQDIYEDMVDLCLQLDRPRLALEYAERAKSRALLDLLAYRLDLGVRAKSETDRPLVEDLVRLRAERDRLYRRWEGGEEPGEESRADPDQSRQQAYGAVLALEKQITETWHQLLVRNADYARDASLWQVRTEPVQPYLDPDTALVEYFVCHGQLVAFVVSEERIDAYRLAGDTDQVRRLIQLLWLNLRAVPSGNIMQTAHRAANAQGVLLRLYDHLFAPLSDALRFYPKLIVVPHGSLHYLPFQALYDGTAFLLERH